MTTPGQRLDALLGMPEQLTHLTERIVEMDAATRAALDQLQEGYQNISADVQRMSDEIVTLTNQLDGGNPEVIAEIQSVAQQLKDRVPDQP
jgi:peptidoglycan hydrolase CwlO-like protein